MRVYGDGLLFSPDSTSPCLPRFTAAGSSRTRHHHPLTDSALCAPSWSDSYLALLLLLFTIINHVFPVVQSSAKGQERKEQELWGVLSLHCWFSFWLQVGPFFCAAFFPDWFCSWSCKGSRFKGLLLCMSVEPGESYLRRLYKAQLIPFQLKSHSCHRSSASLPVSAWCLSQVAALEVLWSLSVTFPQYPSG